MELKLQGAAQTQTAQAKLALDEVVSDVLYARCGLDDMPEHEHSVPCAGAKAETCIAKKYVSVVNVCPFIRY